jgi:MFS family permease
MKSLSHLFSIDITPLKINRNYRWLYTGQIISFFGSMITYVAIPYQMYEITKSTFHVGMLGIVQLIPLVISGFWGGAFADSFDRRRIVIITEIGSGVGNLLLVLFTLSESGDFWILYLLSALMAVCKGFERPPLEALTQQLIAKKDIPRVSTLQSIKTTLGMIMGPALGGILISSIGIAATYLVDFLTYGLSIFCLCQLRNIPSLKTKRKVSLSSVAEGFRYALGRSDLLGTYLVDMVAMTFAYPNPLFPALADQLGGAGKLGWFYSAPAVGAFLASLTSGWTHKILQHGKGIAISAVIWCLGIIAFGFVNNFYLSLLFLAVAGFADMISGIFRATIWNETIPEEYRGRLASVEMISYSSGPLLGNTFMGILAEQTNKGHALMLGGVVGGVSVIVIAIILKSFWDYRAIREI